VTDFNGCASSSNVSCRKGERSESSDAVLLVASDTVLDCCEFGFGFISGCLVVVLKSSVVLLDCVAAFSCSCSGKSEEFLFAPLRWLLFDEEVVFEVVAVPLSLLPSSESTWVGNTGVATC